MDIYIVSSGVTGLHAVITNTRYYSIIFLSLPKRLFLPAFICLFASLTVGEKKLMNKVMNGILLKFQKFLKIEKKDDPILVILKITDLPT